MPSSQYAYVLSIKLQQCLLRGLHNFLTLGHAASPFSCVSDKGKQLKNTVLIFVTGPHNTHKKPQQNYSTTNKVVASRSSRSLHGMMERMSELQSNTAVPLEPLRNLFKLEEANTNIENHGLELGDSYQHTRNGSQASGPTKGAIDQGMSSLAGCYFCVTPTIYVMVIPPARCVIALPHHPNNSSSDYCQHMHQGNGPCT
jgi:hypothetical protein